MRLTSKFQGHEAMWQSIVDLPFDEGEIAFPFASRLARENDWSEVFSQRVIQEYRRFFFMIIVSGRELTPSDEVDQAWHLHLLYTRHYWGIWTETLGQKVHHGPTKGGVQEAKRFDDIYRSTLNLYQDVFGEKPPEDIWPPPEERFRDPARFRRLDVSQFIILERPKGWRRWALIISCILLVVLLLI